MRRWALVVAWLLGCVAGTSSTARSQDGESVEDLDLSSLLGNKLEDELGTTEAASRSEEQVLRAPATVTTIDSQAIRLSGAATLPELLRSLPGVQVYQTAPGLSVVSVRGTGGLVSNNTIVLVDGIPVNNPLDGSVSWQLLPLHLEDIERVEVVRGPVSTIYGANAYTGVINIVTYRGFGKGPHYGARLRGGTDLKLSPFGNVSGRYVVNGAHLQQGWFAQGTYDATHRESDDGETLHTPLTSGTGLGRLGFTFERSSLTLEAGGGFARASSTEHLVLEAEPEDRSGAFAGFQYRRWDLPGAFDTLQFWGQANALRVSTDARAYDGFSYADTVGTRVVAGADLDLLALRILRVSLSGAFMLDWIDAPYLHSNVQGALRMGSAGGASVVLDPLRWLTLSLAGRVDAPPVSGEPRLSYRASAVLHRESWALRLAGGRAFRAPTYVEAGGRFTDPRTGQILLEGEPRIEAPTNDAVELGALFSPTTTVSVGATAYYSRLSNVMVEDFAPLVRKTYVTDPDARQLLGFELEATWRFRDWLCYRGAATYLYWLDEPEGLTPLVGVPDQSSRFAASSGVYGTLRNETFGYGLTGTLTTERRFLVRTGIPPQILEAELDPLVFVTAMAEQYLGDRVPLWASLRAQVHPAPVVDSPLPSAGVVGARVLAGFEVRGP